MFIWGKKGRVEGGWRCYNQGLILRPKSNGRHFPDDIFKCIFLNENIWIWIQISLKFVPKSPALVQIMAWRRPGPVYWRIYASLSCNELKKALDIQCLFSSANTLRCFQFCLKSFVKHFSKFRSRLDTISHWKFIPTPATVHNVMKYSSNLLLTLIEICESLWLKMGKDIFGNDYHHLLLHL